jgi:hypothetical protein
MIITNAVAIRLDRFMDGSPACVGNLLRFRMALAEQ